MVLPMVMTMILIVIIAMIMTIVLTVVMAVKMTVVTEVVMPVVMTMVLTMVNTMAIAALGRPAQHHIGRGDQLVTSLTSKSWLYPAAGIYSSCLHAVTLLRPAR